MTLNKSNKQQLFDGKYSLDQALANAQCKLGKNLSKIDLLKALSNDNTIEFHCYARNLPLLVELIETTYVEGKGTIATPIGYEINCYTGFFNLTLSDCGEGADYISNLAHNRENKGVISIEGLGWEECGSLVADLDKIKGFENYYFDCEGAKLFSRNVEPFEYIPTKPYQPKIEELYIERVRFDLWIRDIEGVGVATPALVSHNINTREEPSWNKAWKNTARISFLVDSLKAFWRNESNKRLPSGYIEFEIWILKNKNSIGFEFDKTKLNDPITGLNIEGTSYSGGSLKRTYKTIINKLK